MKAMVFDTGSIVSLATNNLLTLLKRLKEAFAGDFFIPPAVKKELIDVPLKGKRYKFEALQVQSLINDGVLVVRDEPEVQEIAKEFTELANGCFEAKGRKLAIVQAGEIEVLALSRVIGADALVIDERTIRWLIERPEQLVDLLGHRLHTKVRVDEDCLGKLSKFTKNINVIRSTELVTIAFEKGLLDQYLPSVKRPRRVLIESLLWALKLRGCAITRKEIDQIIKLESA